MLYVVLVLVGLVAITATLASASGAEFNAPGRNYNKPRI